MSTIAAGAPAEPSGPSFGNRIVTQLLRSPLHGLLSARTMLISVEGRRTGRLYTTPVNYVRQGDAMLVVSKRERTWWRNLHGGGRVTLLVKGQELRGTAEVVEDDPEAIARGYQAVRRGTYGQEVPDEKARRAARDRILVRITLSR